MRITPLDIRKQEFRRVMRGLDPEEVYAFLSTVADEYEMVLNDNKALRERLLELDDKVQEYRNMEKTLRNTLLTAERVTGEAKENARREAELIIKEAEIEAERTFRDVKNQAMKLRTDLQDLKRQKENYLSRLKMLVESHLKIVDNADREFTDEDKRLDMLLAQKASAQDKRSESKEKPLAPGGPAKDERLKSNIPPVAPPAQSETPPMDRTFSKAVNPGESPQDIKLEAAPSPNYETSGSALDGDSDKVPDLNEILDRMAESQKETLRSDEPKPAGSNPLSPPGSSSQSVINDPASHQPGSIPPMGGSSQDITLEENPPLPRPAEASVATMTKAEEQRGAAEAAGDEEMTPEDQIKQEILSRSFGDDENTS